MINIGCKPGDLDNVREMFKNFSHFTVRNGKAIYHLLHLPDYSVGIYYALRMGKFGLEGKRALEPTDKIVCWGDKLK